MNQKVVRCKRCGSIVDHYYYNDYSEHDYLKEVEYATKYHNCNNSIKHDSKKVKGKIKDEVWFGHSFKGNRKRYKVN